MSSLSIKQKLLVLLVVPLSGILFYSFILTKQKYDLNINMQKLHNIAQLSANMSILAHQLQKERGLSAGFISSGGKNFKDNIEKQISLTNNAIDKYNEFETKLNDKIYTLELKNILLNIKNKLNDLTTLRTNINQLNIKLSDALSSYTLIVEDLLSFIAKSAKLSHDSKASINIFAYANFLYAKEKAGIERAVGTSAFSSDSFNPNLKNRFNSLITQQNTYMDVFFKQSSEENIKFYQNKMHSQDIDEVQRMRKWLQNVDLKHTIISHVKEIVGFGGLIDEYRKFQATKNETFKENFLKKYKVFENNLNEYKKFPVSNKEKELLKTIKDTFDIYKNNILNEQNQTLNSTKAIHAFESLSVHVFGDSSNYWFDKMTKKIDILKQIDDHLSQEILTYTKDLSTQANNTFMFYLLLTICIILLSLGVGFFTMKNITTILKSLEDVAHQLALGDGDLTKRLHISSNDEIASASKAINLFIQKVQDIVKDAKYVSEQSLKMSDGLLNDAINMQKIITSNNNMLNNTKQSIDQENENLKKTYSKVQYSKLDIQKSNQSLHVTQNSLLFLNEKINQTSQLEDELAKRLSSLNSQTDQVKNILQIISDIADQTNLLALNAAIEAARAGEHGRSFSVVADEVKLLAEKTQKSLQDIVTTINIVVEAIVQTSEKMSQNAKIVNELTDSSTELSLQINNVSKVMQTATITTNEAMEIFEKVMLNSKENTKTIDNIYENSFTSTQATNHIQTASKQLQDSINALTCKLNSFKV